jgi:hypothetical protein
MPRYQVTYRYRTDNGLNYSLPTAHGTIEVTAPDRDAAAVAAIDAVYAHRTGMVSHVRINSVDEVGNV